MTKVKTSKPKLSLNVQHDYITLRTPNGNYTNSWGGSKASGNLVKSKNGFANIDRYVMTESKTSTFMEVMERLTDESVLSKLWVEWDAPVLVNDFEPTERVVFNDKLFLKNYPNGGIVKKVSKKNVFVTLIGGKHDGETIGFDYQWLKRI